MKLDFLELACPALDQVRDHIATIPDFDGDDAVQRQITKELAGELRHIAKLLDRAAKS